MIILPLNIPSDAHQVGDLWDEYELEDLSQDLLQIQFANGYAIDVGWYPEHDPNGTFVVTVFENEWENRKFTTHAKTPEEVQSAIERCVRFVLSARLSSLIESTASGLAPAIIYQFRPNIYQTQYVTCGPLVEVA